jgi:hypothetical protein
MKGDKACDPDSPHGAGQQKTCRFRAPAPRSSQFCTGRRQRPIRRLDSLHGTRRTLSLRLIYMSGDAMLKTVGWSKRPTLVASSALLFAGISLLILQVSKAQAQATPFLPAQTQFNRDLLNDSIRAIKAKFDLGVSTSNPDGKPISQWTTVDFRKFTDEDIFAIRAAFVDERYDLIDSLKPTAMSRSEFSRAILRESARRGVVENFYDRRFQGMPMADVTVARPLQATPSAQRQVSANPVVLALFDTAKNVIRDPRTSAIAIEPDVVNAMRRPDLALHGVSIANDSATYDLGYTAGALPQYRREQPLEIVLGFAQQPPQVQQAFCPIVNEIFRQSGRTLDQTEAFSAGFAQARIDARTSFQGQDIASGFVAACASITPLATRENRINFAIVR